MQVSINNIQKTKASTAFLAKRKEMENQMKRVLNGLKKLDKNMFLNPTNFGVVGSLGHAVEKMGELADFLGG